MTELVIFLAFLVVGKNLICLGRFLEFLFGGFVIRVLVGMIFDGELAVSLFISSAVAFLLTPSTS